MCPRKRTSFKNLPCLESTGSDYSSTRQIRHLHLLALFPQRRRLTGIEAGHQYHLLGQRHEHGERYHTCVLIERTGEGKSTPQDIFKGTFVITSKDSCVFYFQEAFLSCILWGWGKGAWKSIHVTRFVGTAVFPSKPKVALPLLVPLYYGIPDMSTTQGTIQQMD